MSRNNLPENWDAQEHPSLDMLRQYQTGELSAPQSHQLERHLVSCEMCSDLLEGMTLAKPARVKSAVRETRGRLKDLLAQKKRKRKVFQWPTWQTAAVLLVLLFAIAEVVYHQYFANPKSTTTKLTLPASVEPTDSSQTWRLHGRVVDSNRKALVGAFVRTSGTNMVALTDKSGAFSFDVPIAEDTLFITHHDYIKQKTIIVKKTNSIVEIMLTKEE